MIRIGVYGLFLINCFSLYFHGKAVLAEYVRLYGAHSTLLANPAELHRGLCSTEKPTYQLLWKKREEWVSSCIPQEKSPIANRYWLLKATVPPLPFIAGSSLSIEFVDFR